MDYEILSSLMDYVVLTWSVAAMIDMHTATILFDKWVYKNKYLKVCGDLLAVLGPFDHTLKGETL